MAQVADTDITVMAEKSSNLVGVVAVIDMKAKSDAILSFAVAGIVCAADSASAALGLKHEVIGSKWNPIVLLQAIVSGPVSVFMTPFFLKYRGFIEVARAPSVGEFRVARTAASAKPVKTFTLVVEIRDGFDGFAALTGFQALWILVSRRARGVLFLLRNHARLTVKIEAVRFGAVFVKLVEGLRLSAGLTGFHVRLWLSGKFLSVPRTINTYQLIGVN